MTTNTHHPNAGDGSSNRPVTPAFETLVKSRQRKSDHGEVFTPAHLVEDMLDLVKNETERTDSRFLEPGCGSGNFLLPVLRRKLEAVEKRHGTNRFEKCHYTLLAVMSVYGIELLDDNVAECRQRLLDEVIGFVGTVCSELSIIKATQRVVGLNVVQGDALSMRRPGGEAITFPEWSYLGKGTYQRRDFRYDTLTQMSSFDQDSLFGDLGNHEIFTATKEYPAMTMMEIADD